MTRRTASNEKGISLFSPTSKPEAKTAFLQTINDGTIFVNFLGHANWNMLAHENMFRTPNDLSMLHNIDYLPIFYAGTCEVARVDDPTFTSMAEYLLLHPEGGVIACVGSARWNMHLASSQVGNVFYEKLFDMNRGNTISIGQALMQAKTVAGYPDQTDVMFLIGDPALRMPLPKYHVDV